MMIIVLLTLTLVRTSSQKISNELLSLMKEHPDSIVKVWVYFTDKGIFTEKDYYMAIKEAEKRLPPGVRKKRRKLNRKYLCDFTDIPVKEEYVERLKETGAKIYCVSKWLNAVSCKIEAKKLYEIKDLKFVYKIRKVRRFVEKLKEVKELKEGIYGDAMHFQYRVINIPKLHDEGYLGQNVLVGVVDAGFDLDDHPALREIKSKVVAKRNFVDVPEDEVDTSWESVKQTPYHGTRMVCLIAGKGAFEVIGAAPECYLALARTEDVYTERIAEEDFWIAGVEWLTDEVSYVTPEGETLGVEIISSSLGYKFYPYSMMTGDTIPMSKVASLLARKGVLLVTAMGNVTKTTSRLDTCIVAPADAESILAVGAVDTTLVWKWFETSGGGLATSALGPTADGRIKPDVVGPWYGWTVLTPDSDYTLIGGTSVATAVVAGMCAAILSGHPDWTPYDLRNAIIKTASRANNPNDTLGYGIPDPWQALNFEKPIPGITFKIKILNPYPNPFIIGKHKEVTIPYFMTAKTYAEIKIYSVSGRLVKSIEAPTEDIIIGINYIKWDGKDENGVTVPSGVYILVLKTGVGGKTALQKLTVVR